MNARCLVPLIVLVLATSPALADKDFTGKVMSVQNGDSLIVQDSARVSHRIRLAGIDAPEQGQPFKEKAREVLFAKVFRKTVRINVVMRDGNREVGYVDLGDRHINEEMVREGFAWRYAQHDTHRVFAAAEQDAREHKRGLWADPNPIPPWEFRRQKRAGAR